MSKECFVCGREISKKETMILTLEGACCTTCQDTKEYREIMHKAKKRSLSILNNHFN